MKSHQKQFVSPLDGALLQKTFSIIQLNFNNILFHSNDNVQLKIRIVLTFLKISFLLSSIYLLFFSKTKKLCAYRGGIGSCTGDVSSPLACHYQGRWLIAGISSAEGECQGKLNVLYFAVFLTY